MTFDTVYGCEMRKRISFHPSGNTINDFSVDYYEEA